MAKKKEDEGRKIVADNRRARRDYFIDEIFEAGIMLTGTEVKSLREGRANIAEAYGSPEEKGIWLVNANIPVYSAGNRLNHEPKRRRKLLLNAREIAKLRQAVERKGATIVPMKLYFNARGLVKLEIGLAHGKKAHDKRDTVKQRDWNRQKQRLLRDQG